MKKLFWGFFFIYLNFNLNSNQHSLNVIPDFVGYILLLQGTGMLQDESEMFLRVRPFAVGMAIYTAILWVGALLGITTGEGWLSQILNLIAMVVALYISWLLIQGVRDMERRYETDLNSGNLLYCWKGLAAIQLAAQILALMVNLVNLGILTAVSVILIIVGFVLMILYLVAWHKSVKAYERLPVGSAGLEF